MAIITSEQLQAQQLLRHKQIPRNLVTDIGDWLSPTAFTGTKVSFFRIGKSLRFGMHGVFGILATFATTRALRNETDQAVVMACFLGAVTAVYASFILGQVPPASCVAPYTVAPHICAFKAAIALIFYCNIRCLQHYFPSELLYKGLVVAGWWPFVPGNLDWDNLNTYLLVLPRFVGVSADMAKVVLTGDSVSTHALLSVQMFLLVFSFLYSLSFRVKHKAMPFIIYVVTTLAGFCLGVFVVLPDMMAQKK